MMNGKPRPTHYVVLTSKADKKHKSYVGVAWEGEWGISVVLNPGVVLDWRMCEEFFISIKPREEGAPKRAAENQRAKEGDDIPF